MPVSGLDIYGPEEGFNANYPYYKLLLYETEFFLYKIVYHTNAMYEEYTFSGTWEKQDKGRLQLKSTLYTVQILKGYKTLKYEKTPNERLLIAKISESENKKLLKVNAFETDIFLKSYKAPPDPLYLVLSGSYLIEYDLYSQEFMLSTPQHGEHGDYEDYFYFCTNTEGEYGIGPHFSFMEIKGSYRIEDKKLYLYSSYTYIEDDFNKAPVISIHKPVKIPVEYVITETKVRLSFSFGGVLYTIEKNNTAQYPG